MGIMLLWLREGDDYDGVEGDGEGGGEWGMGDDEDSWGGHIVELIACLCRLTRAGLALYAARTHAYGSGALFLFTPCCCWASSVSSARCRQWSRISQKHDTSNPLGMRTPPAPAAAFVTTVCPNGA